MFYKELCEDFPAKYFFLCSINMSFSTSKQLKIPQELEIINESEYEIVVLLSTDTHARILHDTLVGAPLQLLQRAKQVDDAQALFIAPGARSIVRVPMTKTYLTAVRRKASGKYSAFIDNYYYPLESGASCVITNRSVAAQVSVQHERLLAAFGVSQDELHADGDSSLVVTDADACSISPLPTPLTSPTRVKNRSAPVFAKTKPAVSPFLSSDIEIEEQTGEVDFLLQQFQKYALVPSCLYIYYIHIVFIIYFASVFNYYDIALIMSL